MDKKILVVDDAMFMRSIIRKILKEAGYTQVWEAQDGEKAMEHLKEISEVVYLKMSYEEMEKRIGNVVDRGVALKPGFTLRDLYNERVPYYEKYADITIDEEGKTPGDTVDALRDIIEGMMDRNMIERIVEEQKKILEEKDRRIEAYEAEIAALKEELALLRSAGTV